MIPSIEDVYAARRRIAPHIHRTPLRRHPGLCELLDADVWVKHENFQILGSFKPRGGLNLVGSASEEERERGYVTASTGNHGQSVSNAARTFGARATVFVPEGANPVKVEAMEALGARVVPHGRVFDESLDRAREIAEETGARFVHSVNEPLIVAGVGTYALEIHEDLGSVDHIFVPVGGGSGASGVCIVSDALSPGTKVVAVQAEAAPAAHHAWKTGRLETQRMETTAEGLATSRAYDLAIRILREKLQDFVLVDDEEMVRAGRLFIRHTRSLVELAAASTLAAAIRMKERLQGRRVVLVASGANVTLGQLRRVLESA
ncbi:MAG: pyridoxal-phosphate dependent enzyme [Longimicrobiales bacterium]|nr:pyridoxal-phosphate dependent enzyme [Longimicrobiales bacterium]